MIWETFAKRQNRIAQAGQQDIYQYEVLPSAFRMQVAYIWQAAIGRYYVPRTAFTLDRVSSSNQFWELIYNTITREAGLPGIGELQSPMDVRCIEHLLKASTSDALDIIQLSFQVIDRAVRRFPNHLQTQAANITEDPDDAIDELNYRFKEHSIGYQYLGGELMRVDSQFVHAEIVKPALSLLNASGFDGPADEFIRAFDHYRHGRNKEAVAEALKAFESTMKSICAARKWTCPATATAKQLIEVLLSKGLIPTMLESHFSGLRTAMESGLPTIRNKTSGHGQGPAPVELPTHFAAYALHLTASNIVFLVEAHKALK
jgi:hypothetical protein